MEKTGIMEEIVEKAKTIDLCCVNGSGERKDE